MSDKSHTFRFAGVIVAASLAEAATRLEGYGLHVTNIHEDRDLHQQIAPCKPTELAAPQDAGQKDDVAVETDAKAEAEAEAATDPTPEESRGAEWDDLVARAKALGLYKRAPSKVPLEELRAKVEAAEEEAETKEDPPTDAGGTDTETTGSDADAQSAGDEAEDENEDDGWGSVDDDPEPEAEAGAKLPIPPEVTDNPESQNWIALIREELTKGKASEAGCRAACLLACKVLDGGASEVREKIMPAYAKKPADVEAKDWSLVLERTAAIIDLG